jgi:hypothetical protein
VRERLRESESHLYLSPSVLTFRDGPLSVGEKLRMCGP